MVNMGKASTPSEARLLLAVDISKDDKKGYGT